MDEKELAALNEERRVEGDEWVVTESHDLLAEDAAQSSPDRLSGESSEGATVSSTSRGNREEDSEFELAGREERRSPAAVFGSKRIGSVVLPEQLLQAIQREIDSELRNKSLLPTSTDENLLQVTKTKSSSDRHTWHSNPQSPPHPALLNTCLRPFNPT